jgi:hypothetical protein
MANVRPGEEEPPPEGGGADEDAAKRHCIGCGAVAPPTKSGQSISSAHGWRLSRRAASNGSHFYEWRCPTCWRRYKDKILSGP